MALVRVYLKLSQHSPCSPNSIDGPAGGANRIVILPSQTIRWAMNPLLVFMAFRGGPNGSVTESMSGHISRATAYVVIYRPSPVRRSANGVKGRGRRSLTTLIP